MIDRLTELEDTVGVTEKLGDGDAEIPPAEELEKPRAGKTVRPSQAETNENHETTKPATLILKYEYGSGI